MTKKARFIEKFDTLSESQKKEAIEFFTKYPNYEKHIDWNNAALTYQDFQKVFSRANSSLRSIKRKAKTNLRLLFENYNCEILRQTDDFSIVVPLDWQCAVFFNSFGCGGAGARWCIGDKDDPSHWNCCLSEKNIYSKRNYRFLLPASIPEIRPGQRLVHKGEYDLAIADYTQALRLNPNLSQTRNNLEALRQMGY
ncbi:MAG: tetratricopeptide repeat protein [Spirochaetia bacterium]|jgi:tetratricopeptide (TPR) repeat protein|nr:tetratricopeptide repeat protein [Spirochaetia bacterium]